MYRGLRAGGHLGPTERPGVTGQEVTRHCEKVLERSVVRILTVSLDHSVGELPISIFAPSSRYALPGPRP